MTTILFAHTNFPAQFGAFAQWLEGQGVETTFITQNENARGSGLPVALCRDHRAVGKETHRYVRSLEQNVITGQAFARAALQLAERGFRPDVIMAHSGLGASCLLPDVWPEACFVPYLEWYYRWPPVDLIPGRDVRQHAVDQRARTRLRNLPLWLDVGCTSHAICPTQFQASQFPEEIRAKITIMHDGVDTDLHAPGDGDRSILARWGIPERAEVLTSITRGMEPHRGFPETMRALALLQRRRPHLHALIGGEDRVAYGAQLPEGESWKQRMLAELDLDMSRVHFTGLFSRRDMVSVMRASDVHVYLTVPFVLSWSLLEAMSTGCLIVASDTAPVREFISDGDTGLLCPMNDPEALAARIESALDPDPRVQEMRVRARARIVDTLDATRVIYPSKLDWLRSLSTSSSYSR